MRDRALDITRDGGNGRTALEWRSDVSRTQLEDALTTPGDLVKESPRFITRRVGGWLLKRPERRGLADAFGYHARSRAIVQSWQASLHLWRAGVGVARPVALARRPHPNGPVLVVDFLKGFQTVEQHAAALAQAGASTEEAAAFLDRLAGAVEGLAGAGAWHADLSGKNILVAGGEDFRFIDLDAVSLGTPLTTRRRFRNHVQLYDSFCDYWDETVLGAFFARLGAPPGVTTGDWLARVREGQAARRDRQLRRWRRQGKVRPPRPGDPR